MSMAPHLFPALCSRLQGIWETMNEVARGKAVETVEYEVEELEKQVEAIQAKEVPFQTAMKAEEDTRPMSELQKIIESRLVDIE